MHGSFHFSLNFFFLISGETESEIVLLLLLLLLLLLVSCFSLYALICLDSNSINLL